MLLLSTCIVPKPRPTQDFAHRITEEFLSTAGVFQWSWRSNSKRWRKWRSQTRETTELPSKTSRGGTRFIEYARFVDDSQALYRATRVTVQSMTGTPHDQQN
jgi:hypothetical protein